MSRESLVHEISLAHMFAQVDRKYVLVQDQSTYGGKGRETQPLLGTPRIGKPAPNMAFGHGLVSRKLRIDGGQRQEYNWVV